MTDTKRMVVFIYRNDLNYYERIFETEIVIPTFSCDTEIKHVQEGLYKYIYITKLNDHSVVLVSC